MHSRGRSRYRVPRFGGRASRPAAPERKVARGRRGTCTSARDVTKDERKHDIDVRANRAVAEFELTLPARAENVAVVRHALGAFGDAQLLPDAVLEDVRLAVTEACTNVVVHAYPDGEEGPMEVLARLDDELLSVTVRDHGPGIVPRTDSPGLGLGLPLIASLAESVQLSHDEETHTAVRMTFALPEQSNGARADAELRG